jgi:hypothetical protein
MTITTARKASGKSRQHKTKLLRTNNLNLSSPTVQKQKILNIVQHLPIEGVNEMMLFAEFLEGKFANSPQLMKQPVKLRGMWRDTSPLDVESLREEMRQAWREGLNDLEEETIISEQLSAITSTDNCSLITDN